MLRVAIYSVDCYAECRGPIMLAKEASFFVPGKNFKASLIHSRLEQLSSALGLAPGLTHTIRGEADNPIRGQSS
jgi:hypothetical protein